jgi:hypothetical protein
MTSENQRVNFFIPMVDMMVSAIFVFIIIVMVLILMVKEEASSTVETEVETMFKGGGGATKIKPSIVESVVANQTAEEILVDDITRNLLEEQGLQTQFDPDKNILEIKLKKPEGK